MALFQVKVNPLSTLVEVLDGKPSTGLDGAGGGRVAVADAVAVGAGVGGMVVGGGLVGGIGVTMTTIVTN